MGFPFGFKKGMSAEEGERLKNLLGVVVITGLFFPFLLRLLYTFFQGWETLDTFDSHVKK